MAPRSILCLAVMVASLGGCSSVATKQDWHYRIANQHRASKAWKCCYSAERRKSLGPDFKDGFKTGYVERSIGKDCRAPAVPPPKYWAAKYQCCEGQQAIQDWFRGYQHGVTAAESNGHPYFNEVPVSATAPETNVTACGKCKSCEPCECQNSSMNLIGYTNQVPPPVQIGSEAHVANHGGSKADVVENSNENQQPSYDIETPASTAPAVDSSPVPPPPPVRDADSAFSPPRPQIPDDFRVGSHATSRALDFGANEYFGASLADAPFEAATLSPSGVVAGSSSSRRTQSASAGDSKGGSRREQGGVGEPAVTRVKSGHQQDQVGLIGGFGAADVVLFGPMDSIFCDDSAVQSASGSN